MEAAYCRNNQVVHSICEQLKKIKEKDETANKSTWLHQKVIVKSNQTQNLLKSKFSHFEMKPVYCFCVLFTICVLN